MSKKDKLSNDDVLVKGRSSLKTENEISKTIKDFIQKDQNILIF